MTASSEDFRGLAAALRALLCLGASRHVATGHDECDGLRIGKSPLLAGGRHPGQSESQRKLSRGWVRNRVCSCGCCRVRHAGSRDIDTLEGRRLCA